MRLDLNAICERLAFAVSAASLLLLDGTGREIARVGRWDDETTLRAISRFPLGEHAIVVIGWKSLPPQFGVERALQDASRAFKTLQ
jgi:hypothetical protein